MRTIIHYSIVIFFSFILTHRVSAGGGIGDAMRSFKIIKINSISQKILSRNMFVLEGDVEVLIDHTLHLCADRVEIDKEKQTLLATAGSKSMVKVESDVLLILTDCIFLSLKDRTGHADSIKFHVKDGFISAARARKVDDCNWEMEDITYTACDHGEPHWAFHAQKAELYKNYLLKASWLWVEMGGLPVFAVPRLVFPLQNRAGSGFLMPRFSFDSELGVGFKQEYYWLIGERCDSTIGFNWVSEKGFLLSNEFRWARSPHNYVILNAQYAEEKDAFLEKRGLIIRGADKRYWIEGKYFQPFTIGYYPIQSLLRFDFGTDKHLGYHFLSVPESAEDYFYNTLIERYRSTQNIVNILIHNEQSIRKQFSDAVRERRDGKELVRRQEHEEKVSVSHLPHVQWNMAYRSFMKNLFYKHDMSADHVFLHERDRTKTYENTQMIRAVDEKMRVDADTARIEYRGKLQMHIPVCGHTLRVSTSPLLRVRSNVYNAKGSRHGYGCVSGDVEWDFPEYVWHNAEHTRAGYLQPSVHWSYVPKIKQTHWYHMDRWDRVYPQNSIECAVRNNWQLHDLHWLLNCTQGYDFYRRDDLFVLRRSYDQRHLLPFLVQVGCSADDMSFDVIQEYNWQNLSLAQLVAQISLKIWESDVFVSYVYQNKQTQKDRSLLSDVPHFALIGCSVPIGKRASLHYDGSFYSKYTHAFPFFNTMRPLLHQLRFDYDGHCWGISLGFEEKRYRQYGNWRKERSFTISIRLDSIGSMSQKFKRPVVERAPEEYEA